jgi:butyrate kinase
MGGGISVAAHKHGVIVDSNNATKGEGPFSPSRSGTLPMEQIIEACYSGKYSQSDAINLIMPQGGVKAYLGTDDMRKVEQMISEGNTQAELVFKAMGYQTAKEIGAYVAVLYGKADAIILTGGIAHSARMAELIGQRVSTFAPFYVYPGEFEQEALINGALRVLRGQEKPRVYGEK